MQQSSISVRRFTFHEFSPDAVGIPTTACASDRQKPCQQDGWKFRRSAPRSSPFRIHTGSQTVIRLQERSHRQAGRSQSGNPLIHRTGHEASFASSGQSSRSSGYKTRDAPDTDVSFREQTAWLRLDRKPLFAYSHILLYYIRRLIVKTPLLFFVICANYEWEFLSYLHIRAKSLSDIIEKHQPVHPAKTSMVKASAPRKHAVQKSSSMRQQVLPPQAVQNRPQPVLRQHHQDADAASDAAV